MHARRIAGLMLDRGLCPSCATSLSAWRFFACRLLNFALGLEPVGDRISLACRTGHEYLEGPTLDPLTNVAVRRRRGAVAATARLAAALTLRAASTAIRRPDVLCLTVLTHTDLPVA
jgi:hypothetical protein